MRPKIFIYPLLFIFILLFIPLIFQLKVYLVNVIVLFFYLIYWMKNRYLKLIVSVFIGLVFYNISIYLLYNLLQVINRDIKIASNLFILSAFTLGIIFFLNFLYVFSYDFKNNRL
jgi:hypothetical protein